MHLIFAYLYGIFVFICTVWGYRGANTKFVEGLVLCDLICVKQNILFKRICHFHMSTNSSLVAKRLTEKNAKIMKLAKRQIYTNYFRSKL